MSGGRIPGQLGVGRSGRNRRLRGASAAGADSTLPGYSEFKHSVLDGQVRGMLAKGRQYFPAVPDDELQVVEGEHRMRLAAAQNCRALLDAARKALSEARAQSDSHALQVESIGVQSAYRDFSQDSSAWERSFRKHYKKTLADREAALGGVHGDAAQRVLVRRMRKFKAPPGFSNHSNGTAVDFKTVERGTAYVADSNQREGWRATWLHRWLVSNAASFGFEPLSTEEWHWDFR